MDSSHLQQSTTPGAAHNREEQSSPAVHAPEAGEGGKSSVWMGRAVWITLLVVIVIVGGLYLFDLVSAKAVQQGGTDKDSALAKVDLVKGRENTIVVPDDVRVALGIRKGGQDRVYKVEEAKEKRKIVMPGSTALNPSTLYRIKVRFAPCEVYAIAKVPDLTADDRNKLSAEEASKLPEGLLRPCDGTGDWFTAAGILLHKFPYREMRSGDAVKKGDHLATVFSVDVGQKKNDLIDAASQLSLDQKIFDASSKMDGVLPEVFILNSRRNVEADRNNVARALNTLQAWNIPEKDIQDCFTEAEEIIKKQTHREVKKEYLKKWARVDLYAPEDGTIVDCNVSEHEIINDNTVNLFQIAKVERLSVFANVPEDEVPALMKLPTEKRRWVVQTVGSDPVEGRISDISLIIDPNQHTAVVKGYIENPRKVLRAGQFISATVLLDPPEGVVEVPVNAVVEDGQTCVVFVQDPQNKEQYTMRRVQPVQRFDTKVFIRSTDMEDDRTDEEKELGILPKKPLKPGECILTSGVGELKAKLLDLQSQKSGNDK